MTRPTRITTTRLAATKMQVSTFDASSGRPHLPLAKAHGGRGPPPQLPPRSGRAPKAGGLQALGLYRRRSLPRGGRRYGGPPERNVGDGWSDPHHRYAVTAAPVARSVAGSAGRG